MGALARNHGGKVPESAQGMRRSVDKRYEKVGCLEAQSPLLFSRFRVCTIAAKSKHMLRTVRRIEQNIAHEIYNKNTL